MTNYESKSYFVEDQAGESVAFSELPDRSDDRGSADAVMKLWSTQIMPDGRPINVEVGFSLGDVRGLQSYLNDQYGGGRKTAATREDENVAQYFKSGWMSALREVFMIAENESLEAALIWVRNQEPGAGETVQFSTPGIVNEQAHAEMTSFIDQELWNTAAQRAGEGVMPPEGFVQTLPDPSTPDPDGLRMSIEHGEAYGVASATMAETSDFYGGEADSAPVHPNYTPGPEVYQQRQCPALSNGAQCNRPEGHGNTDGLTHYFPGQGLQVAGQPMTSDGAATPPATGQPASATGVGAPEQGVAAASATGATNTAAAPSDAPKTRKRRTKLEMAYDRAQEAWVAGGTDEQAAELRSAREALRAKDPDNSRLTDVSAHEQPNGNTQVVYTPPAQEQPTVQFAGEPVNPFTQPPPELPAGYPPPVFSTGLGQAPVTIQPAEQQAARGFPCPVKSSDGRDCQRPYGHELQTANNPEPKPHVYATGDPSQLGQQPAVQVQPLQQPAFSVSTPALTGITETGAQILSFQTPPTPADPTAFQQPQIQGANLQPPAPAAPFLQPTPTGGQ